MLKYVLQRLCYVIVIAAVMTVLVFAATHILPGNAAVMIMGKYGTPEQIAALETKLGLHQPLMTQYWRWASGFVQGDFGQSLIMDRPVAPMVAQALSKSLILAVAAMSFVTMLGLFLGVISAAYAGRTIDHVASVFSYLGISVPEFFWGIVLIVVFAGTLGWLPASGHAALSDGVGKFFSHLVLPVTTLTLTLLAHVSRMTRSSMLEALQSEYVKAARARGVPERLVIVRHALRNGLLPTITVLAADFGFLIGGIVVVETVFAYPGIGRLLIFAIERHDLPVMQAIILLLTLVYTTANLIADLLYAYFNPRIRYGGSVD
jgi:peptide/nickel transport system permease protein